MSIKWSGFVRPFERKESQITTRKAKSWVCLSVQWKPRHYQTFRVSPVGMKDWKATKTMDGQQVRQPMKMLKKFTILLKHPVEEVS